MKVEKLQEINLNISGARLLSRDEVVSLIDEDDDASYGRFGPWWTSDTSGFSDNYAIAAIANQFKNIEKVSPAAIRPVLVAEENLFSEGFKKGDVVFVNGVSFIVIAKHLLWMHKNTIGEVPFEHAEPLLDKWFARFSKESGRWFTLGDKWVW